MTRLSRLPRSLRAALLLAVIAIAVFAAGFGAFVAGLPKLADADPIRLAALTAETPPARRGIVALTGGAGARIEHALTLHAAGLGDRVLISGVNPAISKADLSEMGRAEQLDCCVDLGPFARTTRGNALETRSWLRSHGYDTVLLVTSNFHLPRARAELEALAPELRVIGVPVDSNLVPEGRWAASPRAWTTLAKEYVKLLVVRLRSLT